MKYAIVDGNKVTAFKGGRGKCPTCPSEMIAKCGEDVMHHWAHKSKMKCDPWWEPETQWHRDWKNHYPENWQEVIKHDETTGEKHIADVQTKDGLTIEFQHSAIKPEERVAREGFYKNMVWIVDGARLKSDYSRFEQGVPNFRRTSTQSVFYVHINSKTFHPSWMHSAVPVVFDFRGLNTITNPNDRRNHLYCLLPQNHDKYAVLVVLRRQDFIKITMSGEWLSITKGYRDNSKQAQQASRQQVEQRSSAPKSTSKYVWNKGKYERRIRL